MTAATEKWIFPEDLTEAQKALPVVAAWKYVDHLPDGGMKAINLMDQLKCDICKMQVERQSLKLGYVSEVREGVKREDDVVILYRGGYSV